MKFTANFPRVAIEQGIPFVVGDNDWLISIPDCDTPDANVANSFGRVLFLHFDDTEQLNDRNAIQSDDVNKIVDFINQANQREASVWVNCHAGICRSGAIVEVLKMLGWTVAESWLIAPRIPNQLVFQSVRKRFPQLLQSWDNTEE